MSQMQAKAKDIRTSVKTSLAILVLLCLGVTGAAAQESAAGDDTAHQAPSRWSVKGGMSNDTIGNDKGSRWDHDINSRIPNEALSSKPVNITVNVNGPRRNKMMSWALGATTATYDGLLINPKTVDLLRKADILTLRFPGGAANVFHWATHTATKPAFGDASYLQPNNNIGFFSMLLSPDYLGGTAIMQVNYGSNQKGDGPGEPFEAAAFVAYVNGKVGDTRPIGVDSTGFDWKTVGFWAGLRAAKALESDDGYNVLRVGVENPLGIVYWEVGDQNYNNGYYADFDAQHPGGATVDLHAPYGSEAKEAAKSRAKNGALSPEAFGRNFLAFKKAMTAVDPKIHVGAPVMTPGVDKMALEYNGALAKVIGSEVDFVSIRWINGSPMPPDWKNLDEAKLLGEQQAKANEIMRGINDEFNNGKFKRTQPWPVQLIVSELGIQSWLKAVNPVAPALYAADAYLSLMERGAVSIDWDQLHSPFLLNDNETPGAAYQGIRMVRAMLGRNDPLLDSSTANGLLMVHAAQQVQGHRIAVMLINKDPKSNGTAKITVNGASLKPTGVRFDFDGKSANSETAIKRSELTGVGPTFMVQVPSYSITVLWLDEN